MFKPDYEKYDYIIINDSYGGFSISPAVCKDYGIKPFDKTYGSFNDKYRTDKRVIQILIEKGWKYVAGEKHRVKLVRIPKGVPYEIEDYDDGYERVNLLCEVEDVAIPDVVDQPTPPPQTHIAEYQGYDDYDDPHIGEE